MSIIESIELEYNRPFNQMSTSCGIYWICCYAMSHGVKQEAEHVFEYEPSIVWC